MIGTNFRRKREEAGYLQAELAEKLLISQPMLAQIELGMKMPSVQVVKLASELLQCTTDELIKGEDKK